MGKNRSNLINLLIDTDVFTYIFKKTRELPKFQSFLSDKTPHISFVTIGETYFGALNANWGDKLIGDLKQELSKYGVVYPNRDISLLYGKIRSECLKIGKPIDEPDYWIGACAIYHDSPLLTNNWKHFKYIKGLKLIKPEY
jgi:predicted nucleic acid-binding protein